MKIVCEYENVRRNHSLPFATFLKLDLMDSLSCKLSLMFTLLLTLLLSFGAFRTDHLLLLEPKFSVLNNDYSNNLLT